MAKISDALDNPREIIIDLLRHGEPEGGEMYRGTRDDPLSAKGWLQMRAAVASSESWDRVVTSPLRRCAEFAAEIAQERGIPIDSEEGFREVCFGDWEGRRPEEISASQPTALIDFWRNPVQCAPQGAESFTAFVQRIGAAWDELVVTTPSDNLLLVCHGGVIRAVLTHIMQSPVENMFRLHVPYAGRTQIKVYRTKDGILVPSIVRHSA